MLAVHPAGRRSLRRARTLGVLLAAVAVLAAALPGAASASPHRFRQSNLVSDIPGVARITDHNLVNPWGLAAGPNAPLWVADNGPGLSTLYTGAVHGMPPAIASLVVTIPDGKPTGQVFNGGPGFDVGGGGGPAKFIFASEAGAITAWSPTAPPLTSARTIVPSAGAVYKGLAIADSAHGTRLYAADFHHGRIAVFDDHFAPVSLPGGFVDPTLPAGFAPFNVQALGGRLYVAYAKQDADAQDEVPGAGLGYVDVYRPDGRLIRRLVSGGALNAPWGLAIAPPGFGGLDGALLVGNFGDGTIGAYDRRTGAPLGRLRNRDGSVIAIDGLWALQPGNGAFASPRSIVFSAGIADEAHGLLGVIRSRR